MNPNHPMANPSSTTTPVPLSVAASLSDAPGREIEREVRRVMPDGRVVVFFYYLSSYVKPDGTTFSTWEIEQLPTVDCSCSPLSPSDVAWCELCSRVVCVRNHSMSCQSCGRTRCSSCLTRISLDGATTLVCKPCAFDLTAGLLRKAFRKLVKWFWVK